MNFLLWIFVLAIPEQILAMKEMESKDKREKVLSVKLIRSAYGDEHEHESFLRSLYNPPSSHKPSASEEYKPHFETYSYNPMQLTYSEYKGFPTAMQEPLYSEPDENLQSKTGIHSAIKPFYSKPQSYSEPNYADRYPEINHPESRTQLSYQNQHENQKPHNLEPAVVPTHYKSSTSSTIPSLSVQSYSKLRSASSYPKQSQISFIHEPLPVSTYPVHPKQAPLSDFHKISPAQPYLKSLARQNYARYIPSQTNLATAKQKLFPELSYSDYEYFGTTLKPAYQYPIHKFTTPYEPKKSFTIRLSEINKKNNFWNQEEDFNDYNDYTDSLEILGERKVDYPIFSTIPKTSFSCVGLGPGFFADTEAYCQVWHYCDLEGRKESFLCTNGTIYNQAARICDWWYNVDCSEAPSLFAINDDLYKISEDFRKENEQEEIMLIPIYQRNYK